MAKEIILSTRIDDFLNAQIEMYARAKGLEKPDAIREMLSTKCNSLSVEIMQIKTATNLTATETAETRKHVSKVAEILAGKVSTLEHDIDIISKALSTILSKLSGK